MKLLRFALEIEDWLRSEQAEDAVYLFGACCFALIAIMAWYYR